MHGMERRRARILGATAETSGRLAETIEGTPMTELVVAMQLPGLDPKKARRSLELFARDVLPASHGMQ